MGEETRREVSNDNINTQNPRTGETFSEPEGTAGLLKETFFPTPPKADLQDILPSIPIATAQPGRSWLCRREALLPLARSYRMKGMPRAGLHCCIHRGSIAVRIVMVRRREEGGELSSCSYLSQCDALQRNDRRRDSQENRIQSGRSRVLASNWPCRQGFQLRQGQRTSCRNPRYNCRTAPSCAVLHEQCLAQGKHLVALYDG